MVQSACSALLTTTANIYKVIEENFQLCFKYIYLEVFSKKNPTNRNKCIILESLTQKVAQVGKWLCSFSSYSNVYYYYSDFSYKKSIYCLCYSIKTIYFCTFKFFVIIYERFMVKENS